MRRSVMLCIALLALCPVARTWHRYFPRKTSASSVNGDGQGLGLGLGHEPGEALFLTPYIESGDFDTAKKLSFIGSVPTYNGSVQGYSGYLTVNKQYSSNLFVWLVLAEQDAATAPLLVWLQGGPGASSLFGLFSENGPFYVDSGSGSGSDSDLNTDANSNPNPNPNPNLNLNPKSKSQSKSHGAAVLRERQYAWTKTFNVLYIDNPVGTGFSFTQSDEGYARNESDVARDLLEALRQFYTLFSEFSGRELYLTGESYAGKYIPALAYAIHVAQPTNFKLTGMAMGNAFIDPETMNQNYGETLFNYGLVDENERDYIRKQCALGVSYIKQQRYMDAFNVFDQLLGGDKYPYPPYVFNATGCSNYYNFVQCTEPDTTDFTVLFNDDFRKAIHVGAQPFNDGSKVENYLLNDMHQSVKWELVQLLNSGKYRVMIYNGQLDIICGLPLSEYMLWTMEWQKADAYRAADKMSWKVAESDTEVAGYVRIVGDTLYQVAIRGAGHMVPSDQPRAAFDMIRRFIYRLDFH